MTLDGSFTIPAPRHEVWNSIRNPALVAPCVPGCTGVEAISPTSYRAKVAVTLGPISTAFDLVVEIADEQPPEQVSIRTRGVEGSRASLLNVVSVVKLAERDAALTEVSYTSDISITGRLGKFGLGMMRKKADQLRQEFVQKFRATLAQAAPA
jgi:carbon monoxide dehydrogenase subunit G